MIGLEFGSELTVLRREETVEKYHRSDNRKQ